MEKLKKFIFKTIKSFNELDIKEDRYIISRYEVADLMESLKEYNRLLAENMALKQKLINHTSNVETTKADDEIKLLKKENKRLNKIIDALINKEEQA